MKKSEPSFFDNNLKVGLALIIPAFVLYAKSLSFEFTSLDEQWMIIQNARYLEQWSFLKTLFVKNVAHIYYRPLFMLSLFIDFHIGKLSPFIYHFSNLIWHLGSVILLYRFLRFYDDTKKTAFFLSILFSVHPVLLHAVAWIPGRNDSMLTVFMLASLIHLNYYFQNETKKNLGLHVLFFGCALFTKETATVFPLIYIALIYLQKNGQFKLILKTSAYWLSIVLGWFVLRNISIESIHTSGGNYTESIKGFFLSLIAYTGKAIIPLQQSIFPRVGDLPLIPGICALIIIVVLWFKPGLQNKKVALLGLFIFLLLLIIPVWYTVGQGAKEQYEHRIYAPLTGLFLFAVQLKSGRDNKILIYVICFLSLLFFIRTYSRMDVYQNKTTFAMAGTKDCPDYYLFHYQLGDLQLEKGNYEEALQNFKTALKMRPDMHRIYNNIGTTYYFLNDYQSALPYFNKAISMCSFNPEYYRNRCVTYDRLNDAQRAMSDLLVLRKCCGNIVPQAAEMEIAKKWDALYNGLTKKIMHDPTNAEFYFKRALLNFQIDRRPEGLADLRAATGLDPANEIYRKTLLKFSGK
ncbi:MAG: tetratricopeptide repeat protein [Bacteroidia bacterium]|nr:tetratricopeptide repeat protein [Bacteroidia bacterium]